MDKQIEFVGSAIREVGYNDMGSGLCRRVTFREPLLIKANEKKRIAKKKLKKALATARREALDCRSQGVQP